MTMTMDEGDRYWAILDADAIVVDIVVWDGVLYDPVLTPKGWTPPEGCTYVEVFGIHYDGAELGGHYDGTAFHPLSSS